MSQDAINKRRSFLASPFNPARCSEEILITCIQKDETNENGKKENYKNPSLDALLLFCAAFED
jgi:hypothetical protein